MKVLYVLHDDNLLGGNLSLFDFLSADCDDEIEPIFLLPKHNKNTIDYLDKKKYDYIIGNYYFCVKKMEKKLNNIIRNIFMYTFGRIHNEIAIKKIIKVIKDKNIDIIHSNSYSTLIGVKIAMKLKIKHVWHIREFMEEDHLISHFSKKRLLKYNSYTSMAIFISNSIKNKYEEVFNKKNIVIYNGIKFDNKYVKEKNFLSNNICNIIIVGSLQKNKCQEDAIEAIRRLVELGYKCHLYICGNGPDYDKINCSIIEKKLTNYISLMGKRNDVTEIRKNMDIALVCSKKEAFGRVTIEGMYYENLVIAANTGGTLELIDNKINGLLYEWGNVEDLVDKIIYAINNKKDVANIIFNAKEESLKKYDVKQTCMKIKDLYKEI